MLKLSATHQIGKVAVQIERAREVLVSEAGIQGKPCTMVILLEKTLGRLEMELGEELL